MRYPERAKRKHTQKQKSVKICFSKPESNKKTGDEGDGVEKPVQTVAAFASEEAFGSPKTQHFEDVVCQLAQLCLVHVNEKQSESHLVFLSLLLRSFHTLRVFNVSCISEIRVYFSVSCFFKFLTENLFVQKQTFETNL